MASTDLTSRDLSRKAQTGRALGDGAKWSARKTVLFVGGASLALWLTILLVAAQLLG